MSKSISLRLPDAVAERLAAVADEVGSPQSSLVKQAIDSYLEEYDDLQEALSRSHDATDPVVSSREMREALGL